MHRKRARAHTLRVRHSAALIAGVAVAALAQQPADDSRGAIRIEVTGSNIPRSESESALPVQVLTRGEIGRSGATTTAELLSKVSANILGFNDQLSIGEFVQPGLSSANLRGIGSGSTLVLLNGRRVANYAFSGGAVDVNTIPLSAIDRVEILKDGASAIYGTDAIAGVINFILRKDFKGFEATGYGAWTEHGGADQRQAIVSAGYGDLSTDRFNIFATLSYQKEDALRAIDRPFSRTGYIPSEGEILLSGASFPANIQAAPGLLVNPAYATGCTPPSSIPVNIASLSRAPICGYDFASTIDIVPQVERTGAVGRATFQVDANNQVFAEADYAYNRFVLRNSPTAIFQGPGASTVPVLYPAGGPYYPTEFAAANGLSGNLNLRYRTTPLGPETDAVDARALRLVAGAEGIAWNWSYDTAITYSENRQTDRFTSGYVLQSRFISALASGLINPFGPSGPDGDALLAGTQIIGDQHHAKASTLDFDIKASREIYTLPAGPLAIALGTEVRREKFDNEYSPAWASGDILSVSSSQQSVNASRNVEALFVEASVPIVKDVEAQIAARYDHYGDFGGTTNPKIALRWQPMRTLLLRTSWGTGFEHRHSTICSRHCRTAVRRAPIKWIPCAARSLICRWIVPASSAPYFASRPEAIRAFDPRNRNNSTRASCGSPSPACRSKPITGRSTRATSSARSTQRLFSESSIPSLQRTLSADRSIPTYLACRVRSKPFFSPSRISATCARRASMSTPNVAVPSHRSAPSDSRLTEPMCSHGPSSSTESTTRRQLVARDSASSGRCRAGNTMRR
jgi:iron complex outermembrane receptor protein